MNNLPLGKIALIACVVWLGAIIYSSDILSSIGVREQHAAEQQRGVEERNRAADVQLVERRLRRMEKELNQLRAENEQLQARLKTDLDPKKNVWQPANSNGKPALAHLSFEHEDARRLVQNGVQELWYSISGHLSTLNKSASGNSVDKHLDNVWTQLSEQLRTVFAHMHALKIVDGAESDRAAELANLTELLQLRLESAQNPGSPNDSTSSSGTCGGRKLLLCRLNKGCGFGCQLHHAAYCLMVAQASGRVLVLDTSNWRYAKHVGWTGYFQPVSRKCDLKQIKPRLLESAVPYENVDQTDQIVQLPIIDALRVNNVPMVTLGTPVIDSTFRPVWHAAHLRLGRFLGIDPASMMYSDRLKADVLDPLDDRLKCPLNERKCKTVGVHVRRTDKVGSEAQFHKLEEYFDWVEQWFLTQEISCNCALTRRVFLATDDPDLLGEATKKYPHYIIFGDKKIALSAQLGKRYSDDSLKGVIGDVYALAQTNYLVCTFSSQVCRLAYELMQVVHDEDRGSAFHSLDDIFYFGGQLRHEHVAIFDHKPLHPGELPLRRGGRVAVAGNHWDGRSKARLLADNRVGLYPSYKARPVWRVMRPPRAPLEGV